MARLVGTVALLAPGVASAINATEDNPFWGCGLLGGLPGISPDGSTTSQMQKMIDGMKASSSLNKVTYWNWNLAPESNPDTGMQYLSKDFIFMPEQWGVGPVIEKYVRTAGQVGYLDAEGKASPSQMGYIFMGANEPDITGSCMGGMMGTCTATCSGGNCPACHLDAPSGSEKPNAAGQCNCWEFSHATGVGFWPVNSCTESTQPLPTLWTEHPSCVAGVMSDWKKTADIAYRKGYKHLTTPLIAANMDWLRSFVKAASDGCSDISCGRPTHVAWHFYASDCRPVALGGYADFQAKLDATVQLMEDYPFLQGAIINEVGMLNCAQETSTSACVPNNGKYPAVDQPDHTCPSTDELPNGMSSFLEHLFGQIMAAKTSDGRPAVVGFSWFNLNMDGGTYNLRIFDDDGNVNALGETYIKMCAEWAGKTPTPSPSPGPSPGPHPSPPPSPPPAPTPTPPAPTPSPPAPTPTPPAPTPAPPAPSPTHCNVGDPVLCPGSSRSCQGNQCCPDGSTCPSAANSFKSCQKPKRQDCTKSTLVV